MTTLDYILIAIIGLSFIRGLKQGLIRTLIGLVGWVAAFVLAIVFNAEIVPFFMPLTADATLQKIAAFATIVAVVVLLSKLLAGTIKKGAKVIKLSWLDDLAGGGFAAAKSIMIFLVALSAASPWLGKFSIFQNSQFVQALSPYAPEATQQSKWAIKKSTKQLENLVFPPTRPQRGGIISAEETTQNNQTENPFLQP